MTDTCPNCGSDKHEVRYWRYRGYENAWKNGDYRRLPAVPPIVVCADPYHDKEAPHRHRCGDRPTPAEGTGT